MGSPLIFPSLKIKEEDLSDIIDLDRDKTPEDLVYEWDAKVRLKFKNYFIVDSEQSLDMLMKWYIQSFKNEVLDFDDFSVLKVLVAKHIQFFKLYFVELNSCFVDNYLDNMEEILTFYSNIEIKSLPVKRRDRNNHTSKKLLLSKCQKLISTLSLYLLNKEDRVYHIIMKIKLNSLSEDGKELFNLVCRKLLTEDPSDKSDLGFCRAYILYQKWKTVRKPEDWEKMDAIMYKLYNQTAESVKTNATLTQILSPQNNSVLDILIYISERHVIITEEYFKFLKSKKTQEDSLILPELSNIEISDEIPDLTDNNEDGDFEKAYQNFVKSMSNLSRGNSDTNESVAIKIEDDDDDCQIIAEGSTGFDRDNSDLVHEILDDDDMEIIYFKRKNQQNGEQIDKTQQPPGLSFLDSIEIPDPSDIPVEKVSSSSKTFLSSNLYRNMVTKSTSFLPYSRKWNSLVEESALQVPNFMSSSINTSNDLEETNDTDSQRSSVTRCDDNVEMDSECTTSASKNSTNMETSTKALSSVTQSVLIKNLMNMQTQTDTIVQNLADANNCLCQEKEITESHIQLEQLEDGDHRNCSLNGNVSPPSGNISPTDTDDVYSNVHAKIIQSHNDSNETAGISKVTDYLPPSVNDAHLEKHEENSQNKCEINTTDDLKLCLAEQSCNYVEVQSRLFQRDDSNKVSDMEFEPGIEPNTKKKHDKDANSSDVSVNQQEVDLGTTYVTEKKIVDDPNASNNSDRMTISQDHELNLNSDNSGQKVVIENLPNASSADIDTNILCGSPDSYTHSSNMPILNVVVSLRSSIADQGRDIFKVPVTSPNSPCTSTDIVMSQDFSKPAIPLPNDERDIRSESCPSPDITSTSTDIQDLHKSVSAQKDDSENQVMYTNFPCGIIETESDPYLNIEENLCVDIDFDCNSYNGDNENVSQSNLDVDEVSEEICIEDTVLLDNREESSYIVEDANVNICLNNNSNHLSINSDLSNTINKEEIVQSEVINQVENVNGGKTIPLTSFRELMVNVEKLRVPINKKKKLGSPKKIMFTSPEKIEKLSVDDFTRFQENIHQHEFDEIFSGPISKVNGISSCVNPITTFDLFNSKAPSISGADSPQTPVNSSGNSSGEVTSPAYERIDDFKSYYEENKNSNMLTFVSAQNKVASVDSLNKTASSDDNSLHHRKQNKVKINSVKILPKSLKSLQNREVKTNNSAPVHVKPKEETTKLKTQMNGKRKCTAFAKNLIDTSNTVSHSPTGITNNVLQGILKKSPSNAENNRLNSKRTKPQITRRVNFESFAQFNVKPNDRCIQSDPCVVIERLSENEISRWESISEASRKFRLEKQRAQFASQQLMYRVDYDKQTTHINEKDVLRFSTPEGITSIPASDTLGLNHWRSDVILQSNSSSLDEGLISNELPYTEKKNGKRKRNNTQYSLKSNTSKKQSVFRNASENKIEQLGIQITRKRKKT